MSVRSGNIKTFFEKLKNVLPTRIILFWEHNVAEIYQKKNAAKTALILITYISLALMWCHALHTEGRGFEAQRSLKPDDACVGCTDSH